MTSAQLESSATHSRWQERVAVFAMITLTALAMGRLCINEFIMWDDPSTVHQNPWLQPPTLQTIIHYWTTPTGGLYIPVTYTAWATIALFAQVPRDEYGVALNPWLFHSANVLCHLLALLVAYRILRLLNADLFAAFCGALLFGVHPVQVEAVAWVSGLKDVLSGLLALVALWQYVLFSLADIRGRPSLTRYILAIAAFLLAMLAKPSAMALPLAALAIDHWILQRSWRRALPAAIVWLAIALPIALLARHVQDASNTPMPALYLRPLIVCDSLAFYLEKLIWPVPLIFDYSRTPAKVLANGWCYWDWIFPVSLAIFLIAGARRRPILLAAGVIFLAGCLPVLGFTPAMFQYLSTTADHYLYLSMFGPALALAWLLSNYPTAVPRIFTCGVLALLIALTIRQGGYWKDDFTFFSHDTEVNPDSYTGFINLGGTYQRQHNLPAAIAAFRRAVAINPQYPLAVGDLASALNDAGQFDEAILYAWQAVELQTEHPNLRPNWPQDNELLGELLVQKGRFAQAIPYLQTAAGLEPDNQHLAKELIEAKNHAATQPADK